MNALRAAFIRSLQIRDLPDDLYRLLSFRAQRAQQSLAQQALIELRGNEAADTQGQRGQTLDSIKRSIPSSATAPAPPPEDLIRADRER